MNYVTLAPIRASVLDPWAAVLGRMINVPGGTALSDGEVVRTSGRVDDDVIVALTLCDPYLPPARVFVAEDDLLYRCQRLFTGTGPRAGQARATCTEHRTAALARHSACLPCYYERWAERARARGFRCEEDGTWTTAA